MTTKFDTTPSLLLPTLSQEGMCQPAPFLDGRYQKLVDVIHQSLPATQLVLVGFWPTLDRHEMDSSTVNQMSQHQNLDIDMFLPVSRTNVEYWQLLQESGYQPQEHAHSPSENLKIFPLGNNNQIIRYNGFTFLSPELSQLSEDELKPIISQALYNQLPESDRYIQTGRSGEPLVVIGENASSWGSTRRQQESENARPYVEIVPLIVSSPHEEMLDSLLEKLGYSRDLAPRYCRVYQGEYSPLDLHLSGDEHVSLGLYGLPELNRDFITATPVNALNWIRREVKAIALYCQLGGNLETLSPFVKQQYRLLLEHIATIRNLQPQIAEKPALIKKINDSFSSVVSVLKNRFQMADIGDQLLA